MATGADALVWAVVAGAGVWAAAARAVEKRARVTRDAAGLEAKLAALAAGGLDSLQIIMDFDRTITTYWGPKGGRGASSHGVAESLRSAAIKEKANALNEYFYPIEVSPTLTREEKVPYMIQWYRGINHLLVESKFRKAEIAPSVAASNVGLRPGAADLFRLAGAAAVPLLIFSAGVGDILAEVIRQQFGALPTHSAIVSNWMRFDGGGTLADWTEPLIHMFNKDDSHLRASPLLPELARRRHVLLVGDSLGDATMADGMPHDVVVRVGLLNDNIDANLAKYTEAFDLVLTGDASLDYLVDFLRSVPRAPGGACGAGAGGGGGGAGGGSGGVAAPPPAAAPAAAGGAGASAPTTVADRASR